MRTTRRVLTIAASCLVAVRLNAMCRTAAAPDQAGNEPAEARHMHHARQRRRVSKDRAVKVFDNLYYSEPGYVSAWL